MSCCAIWNVHTKGRGRGIKEMGGKILMENIIGLLRIRIKRGINLVVRDVNKSDPYVVVRMGKQKLKTRMIKKNVNPEWNEDLTLSVTYPLSPFLLTVYDHDTFSKDDKMGYAECDITPFIEALKTKTQDLQNGTIISIIHPTRNNCLAEDSCIVYNDGKFVQDIVLRLQNVKRGEVEIQLQWIDLPGSKGL
ncbi:PREDICTED: protein C2-DOMAIN ABA-RELATED 4-like [Lupinus angustifolius]|uniref:protein C2-DOMAIN ABA-RELATED 4-like n=1 Tax=Lupinus angustifolius TaxID=3871 RepID=UPI00092E6055|nr:PREDICTED: protein C2-DOMAIN ABA-RELATED 4-like [Lupinus angustifolius]